MRKIKSTRGIIYGRMMNLVFSHSLIFKANLAKKKFEIIFQILGCQIVLYESTI